MWYVGHSETYGEHCWVLTRVAATVTAMLMCFHVARYYHYTIILVGLYEMKSRVIVRSHKSLSFASYQLV